MTFRPTRVDGCFVVEPQLHADARGFFARTFDRAAFLATGLDAELHLLAVTHNARRGTLRGMHFQRGAAAETKLVRVTRGAIYDVALDLRPASPTYLRWHAAELTAENRLQLYVPKGCAHGYLTLTDDAELAYGLSAPHAPEHAGGVRWDDPAFGIAWPAAPTVIAERDARYPDHPV